MCALRAETETGPPGSGPAALARSRGPFPPAPQPHPQPSPPSRPRPAALLHWRPRLARGHPRSAGKRHHFQWPWSISKLRPRRPTPGLSVKNRGQERRGAEPTSNPAPRSGVAPHPRGCARPPQSRPRARASLSLPRVPPGAGAARAGGPGPVERGQTDSRREGEGAGGEGRKGFVGVTFQKNSQRVAGVTPRGEKKFSYHVEREDSQSIFQMGSAFPVPV